MCSVSLHLLKRLPGAIILRMSHGYTVSSEGADPFIELADHAVGTIFSEACQPGTWIVDVAPICMYLLRLTHRFLYDASLPHQ